MAFPISFLCLQKIQLTFDANGFLSMFTDLETQQVHPLSQQFFYYFGFGLNDGIEQVSGAYIFRPRNNSVAEAITNSVTIEVIDVSL